MFFFGLPAPDQTFAFGLNIADKDLDSATTPTVFLVGVDGNHDGLVAGVLV